MDEKPATRYAKAPDGVTLAYQVSGDGPDLLFLTGSPFPIDLTWDEPGFFRFAKRLGRFSRTVWGEARGFGASGGNHLDVFIDDIADGDTTAVLDAAGCEKVAIVGTATAGPQVLRYACKHTERVTRLVLFNTFAHYLRDDDYPMGVPATVLDRFSESTREQWGTGMTSVAPSKAGDPSYLAWSARGERLSVDPDGVADWWWASALQDVRPLLPELSVPTLVLHREANLFIRAEAGRYLAEHIPGAKYVGLPGADHLFFVGDVDALADEIEEFLTGARQAPEGEVVTTTILFTDIVSSTEQSARMGHRKWTKLVDDHDAMVRSTLLRYRGHEVKTTGDGFLATFDATTRAVRAATEIVTAARNLALEVRAGVHTGEVEVRPDDVVGLSVSITKRICDLAGSGQILVSEAVKAVTIGSGLVLTETGTHVLKGVPGEWRLFSVES